MAFEVVKSPERDNLTRTGRMSLSADSNLFFNWSTKPEWDELVYWGDEKYSLALFFESVTKKIETTDNGEYNWSEYGTPYKQQTIKSHVLGSPATTATVVFEETQQYFLVNDIVMLPVRDGNKKTNKMGLVIESGINGGGDAYIIVQHQFDVNFVADDFPAAGHVSYISMTDGECSDAPGERKYFPEPYKNYTSLTRHHHSICDWAAQRILWIETQHTRKWYHQSQMINKTMHRRAVDGKMLFGEQTNFGTDKQVGDGIIATINKYGSLINFGGQIDEMDIRHTLKHLILNGKAANDEWVMWSGIDLVSDSEMALSDYLDNGAEDYGPYGKMKEVGININAYKGIHGAKLKIIHYYPFGDVDFLPKTEGGVNWANFGVLLNVGNLRGGRPNITCVYKSRPFENRGEPIKNLYTWRGGPPFVKGETSNFKGCLEEDYWTEVGLKMPTANRHAIMEGVDSVSE